MKKINLKKLMKLVFLLGRVYFTKEKQRMICIEIIQIIFNNFMNDDMYAELLEDVKARLETYYSNVENRII